MAQVTWTAEAERWLEDIFEYIAVDNPRAAAETIQGIYDQALVEAPLLRAFYLSLHLGGSAAPRRFLFSRYRQRPCSSRSA
jgi:plasmid stabilization system protein ParE